jgi:glycosyltransferase involved in cell wall biosynthesis
MFLSSLQVQEVIAANALPEAGDLQDVEMWSETPYYVKVAVLAAGDPLDVRTWSGTPYYMTQALKTRFPDLLVIRDAWPLWFSLTRRAICRVTGGRVDISWFRSFFRLNADRLAVRLKRQGVDVAVCIGTAPLSAYLSKHVPCIHVSDATFVLRSRFYREFSNLTGFCARNAAKLDEDSIRGSAACLYPTEWAAQSAINDIGAAPGRVYVIPWGCNVAASDLPPWRNQSRDEKCHLVFIGLDWERKGGHIVLDALKQLLRSGFPATLDIIGKMPDLSGLDLPCEVVQHGFINKGTKDGMALFDSIMKRASFLFVPTRQDCSSMVFAEANAYGVPAISTDTGGVSGVVREGINGHLLPPSAQSDQYAQLIRRIWSDEGRYLELRLSSRERFEDTLNWQSWLTSASNVIEDIAAEYSDFTS